MTELETEKRFKELEFRIEKLENSPRFQPKNFHNNGKPPDGAIWCGRCQNWIRRGTINHCDSCRPFRGGYYQR